MTRIKDLDKEAAIAAVDDIIVYYKTSRPIVDQYCAEVHSAALRLKSAISKAHHADEEEDRRDMVWLKKAQAELKQCHATITKNNQEPDPQKRVSTEGVQKRIAVLEAEITAVKNYHQI